MANRVNVVLWGVVGLLLVALAAVAAFKIKPLLYPEVAISVAVDSSCDLHQGPCITKLKDGRQVNFSIEPRPIPLVQPLKLQVELVGMEAESVAVDINGVDMNMGINRPQLQRESGQRYSGEGMLSVCIRDSMEWEAKVLLDTDEGLISVPFRFVTNKHAQ